METYIFDSPFVSFAEKGIFIIKWSIVYIFSSSSLHVPSKVSGYTCMCRHFTKENNLRDLAFLEKEVLSKGGPFLM